MAIGPKARRFLRRLGTLLHQAWPWRRRASVRIYDSSDPADGFPPTSYHLATPSYLTWSDRWLIVALALLFVPITMSVIGLAAFALVAVLIGGGWLVIRNIGRRPFVRSGPVNYTRRMRAKERVRGRGPTSTPSPHDL